MRIRQPEPQLLVVEWSNLGQQMLGAGLIATGVVLGSSLFAPSHPLDYKSVFAMVMAFIGGVSLLVTNKQRYTFDRRIGQLTVESKGLLGGSQQALPLAQIRAIALNRTCRRDKGAVTRWEYEVALHMAHGEAVVPLPTPPMSSREAAHDLSDKIGALLELEPPARESLPPLALSERAIPLPLALLLIALVVLGFGYLVWMGMH